MGNLRSVLNAVRAVAADTSWAVRITADPDELSRADRVI
ncbi:MAG: imidazole glycerol phosphate synthase subunit HisH, partial [Burkholderiaceae bacterium]